MKLKHCSVVELKFCELIDEVELMKYIRLIPDSIANIWTSQIKMKNNKKEFT